MFSIKALIVVVTLAAIFFALARPIALRFISAEDFARRRLVWFVLVSVSFISPNFWIYALLAVPMLFWSGRKDSNPVALYLFMLHVIPPIDVVIPIIGNNGLFDLNNYRLLALLVLLPAAMRYRKENKNTVSSFGAMDILLLASGVLTVALYTPPDLPNHSLITDSPTNVLRRAFLFMLDTYILYYTVSRTCRTKRQIVDAIASFCFICVLLAVIAIFERARNWLLFVDMAPRWGAISNANFYLLRGGAVRAQASAGHSIALGVLLGIALGLWLWLKTHVQSAAQRIGVLLVICLGLFATYSRGAWLGAASIYFAFNAFSPRAISRLVKGSILAGALGGALLMSPVGAPIVDMLPQQGKVADPYRHALSERGWDLVFAQPFFGDQYPWPALEDLRQGEGIIDIVNTYLGVALNYGLVGLFCFVSFILLAIVKIFAAVKDLRQSDPDFALCGTSLIACIVGTMIMIDSDSFTLAPSIMFYVLAGLATAYSKFVQSSREQVSALRGPVSQRTISVKPQGM